MLSAFSVLDQLSCLIYWGLTFSLVSFSNTIPAEVLILIIVVKFLLWLGCLSLGLRPQCIPGVSWPPYISAVLLSQQMSEWLKPPIQIRAWNVNIPVAEVKTLH